MQIYNWDELEQISFELKNNKAAIVETDTVFGIVSVSPQLIYKIKRRARTKKIIKFIASVDQVPFLTTKEREVASKYWPGALTIIKNKQGYRIPNNEHLINLIKLCNGLYSSSANVSGHDPINNYHEAEAIFKKYKDQLIIVKSDARNAPPSTIVSFDKLKVIRNGLIDGNNIIEELKENE